MDNALSGELSCMWTGLAVVLCKETSVSKQCRLSDFQIRGGIEDNSKIIFFYFSTETYVVTPH